jgi:hypothetical protein
MVQLNVRGEAEVSVVADYATIGVKVATIGDSAQGATQLAQPIVDQLRDSLVGAPDVRSVSLGGIAIAKAKHWDSHREEYVEVGWQAVLRGSFEVETVHLVEPELGQRCLPRGPKSRRWCRDPGSARLRRCAQSTTRGYLVAIGPWTIAIQWQR